MDKTKGIRSRISSVFGILIADGEWNDIFSLLERENRLNGKNINKVILEILKYLDEKENE